MEHFSVLRFHPNKSILNDHAFNECMKGPARAELETIGNRSQTFHCFRVTSGFPNHPDSSLRDKKGERPKK